MKKTTFFLLTAFLFLFLFTSCGSKPEKPLTEMEKIQKQLNEMNGYQCSAQMTRISNKGENVYGIKQYFKSTGEYRLELISPETVSGNYSVFDGNKICQYNPRVTGKIIKEVPASKQRNELFLGQFMKNYMQSEEVSVAAMAIEESQCTVLEAVIPGTDPNLATEKLWIDNETLKPVQFIIYNTDGKERYVLQYTDFEYDPIFDEKLFQIEE